VRANIESTLGGNPEFPDVDRIARRYCAFARSRSLFRTPPGSRGFDDPHLWPLVGREHLDAALALGRGAILATGHLGWWLLIAPILRVHGYAVVQTAGPYFEKQRRRGHGFLGPDDIAVTLDVRPIFAALARNRPVLIAGDGRHSLEFAPAILLGRSYPLPTGFMKIAMATRCPVLPVFGLEGARRGSILIEVRPPLRVDPARSAVANLAEYARVLDHQLRRTPHLWTRWDTPDLFEKRRSWVEGAYLSGE
jgi:KDO2-lipid IV(A) lauroyltransferase